MRDFTIGGVVRLTVDLIRRHFGLLFILALILVGLPNLLAAVLAAAAMKAAHGGLASTTGIVPYLGGTLLQAASLYTIVEASDGRSPDISGGLRVAARLMLPLIIIGTLYGLAVGLGFILLIVPGIMLACRWVVVIPVAVVERAGILGSFRRSADLSKGLRWRIFGLVVVVSLIGLLLTFVIGGAILALLLRTNAFSPNVAGEIHWPAVVLNIAFSALAGVVGNVGFAAIYLELRRVKEGTMSQDLVSVFD